MLRDRISRWADQPVYRVVVVVACGSSAPARMLLKSENLQQWAGKQCDTILCSHCAYATRLAKAKSPRLIKSCSCRANNQLSHAPCPTHHVPRTTHKRVVRLPATPTATATATVPVATSHSRVDRAVRCCFFLIIQLFSS